MCVPRPTLQGPVLLVVWSCAVAPGTLGDELKMGVQAQSPGGTSVWWEVEHPVSAGPRSPGRDCMGHLHALFVDSGLW